MRSSPIAKTIVATLALLLATCRSSPPKAPVLGEAYVGPSTLNLRSDIPTQSPTVTTVKHGDRLDIVQQRRSFLKVRAPNGAEGWTDQRQLLAAEDMAHLNALTKRAAAMPSQGRAAADAELRVHMQPYAKSPSILTLKENDMVDVLTHIRRARIDLPRKPLVPPPPKKVKATKKAKAPQYPLPPLPAPPPPPPNWLDLSKTDEGDDEPPAPATPAQAAPSDDWSLVRTPDGKASGWVLTRRLRMAIPDEVGQYAEGRRIVSYFSLGTTRDGDLLKDTWLWTTIPTGAPQPYDFDSFRVFVWSAHRHRYETEYIERNVIGYAPVEIKSVHFSAAKGKTAASSDEYAGFSVCVQKKDGQLSRREYAVLNTIVRFAGEQPCILPPPVEVEGGPAVPPHAAPAPAEQPKESFTERVKKRVKALTGGLFKR